jgi:hypothetical protein
MKEEFLIDRLANMKNVVKDSLRKKGIVTPVKTKRGVKLDNYEIVLERTGYTIYDKFNEPVYERLYYLQTAILVSNSLALKREVKDKWLEVDRTAGVADFDMRLFDLRLNSSIKKQDWFGVEHYRTRFTESKIKHKVVMDELNNAYYRLVNTLKNN